MDPRRLTLLEQFELAKTRAYSLFEEDQISSLNSPLLPLPLDELDSFKREKMQQFPAEKVENFKHVIYNLLVDSYNMENPELCILNTCTVQLEGGITRNGFQFNEALDPERRIPELYALHVRHARLDLENRQSPFIQDLYKFYLRYALELIGKYFEKSPIGKWVFLCDPNIPLFVEGSSLKEAEERIKSMKTRGRKRENSTTESNKRTKY
jgi:hypothetical protein